MSHTTIAIWEPDRLRLEKARARKFLKEGVKISQADMFCILLNIYEEVEKNDCKKNTAVR